MLQRVIRLSFATGLVLLSVVSAAAQAPIEEDAPPQAPPPHDHAAMLAAAARRWQVMWDGNLFTTFNSQGGLRGDDEVRAQNWLMLMGSRQLGRGTLTLSAMASLEPVTVGTAGYSHLFQLGETYRSLPVTDRQHPHDLFMQLDAAWRVPIGTTELSISGGPVGAPAFGLIAFPHRLSASENPSAPLTHHTFDSTHVAMGTVTAGLRRGAFTIEASAFRGREPDEHRYNLESGALDSRAARVTWRPGGGLEFQVSRGYLHQPELLEPGNQNRTNASMSEEPAKPDVLTSLASPPCVPSARPAEVKPIAPERYKIQFTVSRETYEQLRRAQDLLRHTVPTGDPAIIDSRHIPSAVKRSVWQRDNGRCAFNGPHGRCTETGFLEYHHVVPFASGGRTSPSNLELRCRAHNQYEAELWFGTSQGPLAREERAFYSA